MSSAGGSAGMRGNAATQDERGVTLPEVLVVIAIIAMAVGVAVPVISDAVRAARLRSAAQQLATSLRAARMVSVTRQAPVDFVVRPHPENSYEYPDRVGQLRTQRMPEGVRIVSATSPVVVRPNGSTNGVASVVLEVTLAGEEVRSWEVRTNRLGVPTF